MNWKPSLVQLKELPVLFVFLHTHKEQLIIRYIHTYIYIHMASSAVVSKKQESEEGEDEEEIHEKKNNNDVVVATHVFLKPQSNGAPLDREVVLRRIRHRKRVRNVKNAVQALLTSPFSSNKFNNNHENSAVSAPRVKWVDDAFAAL